MTSSVDVLSPVQAELGRRWAAGDLGIADEHAASAAVDDLLVRLGATAESPRGPAVVVASAEHDAHALGGRVVASALALDGYRVMFLGASVPAADLARLSRTATAARARPELLDPDRPRRSGPFGRGRARSRHTRCGRRPRARDPPNERRGSVSTRSHAFPATQSRSCEPGSCPHRAISPPRLTRFPNTPRSPIAATPSSLPRSKRAANGDTTAPVLAEELQRVLQVVESALLVEEPALIEEHVQWLRDTGPAHGFARR